MNIIRKLAKKHITPIQLNYFYKKHIKPNDIIEHSKFIYNEIPIRLSKKIVELYKFPFGLPITNNLKNVIDLYKNSLDSVKSHSLPNTIDDAINLSDTLIKITENHRNY